MSEGQSIWKQSFFDEVEEIRLKDPLAVVLGAMDEEEEIVFKYADIVKMAGHSCPSVSGAYKLTALALKALYGDEIPVRGDIAVTVKGGIEDLTYGPMSQVITLITGASGETGFKGLGGGLYGRYRLLSFDEENLEANVFVFERRDNGKKAKVSFNPGVLPANPRIGELIGDVISGSAGKEERDEFHSLWQGKVKTILMDDKKYAGLFEVSEI